MFKQYLKVLISIFLLFIYVSSAWSVIVVENPQVEEKKPMFTPAQKKVIIWSLIIMILLGLLFLLMFWIWKKIKDSMRKDTDLLFSKYLIDIKNCHQNRDRNLKFRNWKTFFLTWKRKDVILNTEYGLKYFGSYDGELIEANNFYLICIHRPSGFLGLMSEKDVIIIPYELRKLIRKETINGNSEILLEAESVDCALNTDYYAQIVVKNPKNNEKLVNFNDYIVTKYMDLYAHRQIIKDNLMNYHDNMNEAVELNPNIQVARRDPKN